ncbi:MAG: DUF2314 domain-containing protein [Spirochaetaceae bacterium]|jgi:uncharacterized protein YegJ (DUF2314 family)|nr:DUF2314 domain-containing protein [Spirochaetaceae bacterium]
MTRLIALFLIFFYAGCTKQAPVADPTIHRSQDDETLLDIRQQAQETFLDFMNKLLNPEPGEQDFLVKCPFEADPGSGFSHELIWLGDITFENGRHYGSVSNVPYYISNLKFGDRVAFNAETIDDWMYCKDGKIIGGRSIKYLIEQIPQPDWEPDLRRYYEMFE